jgi:anti-sigma-K factor RskA
MDVESYIASGMVEAYVLGLCTNQEKIAFEELLAQSLPLQQAKNAFEVALEQQFLNNAPIPSTATDAKILQTLNTLTTTLKPIQAKVLPIANNKISFWQRKSIAAAAAVFLAGSIFFNVSQYRTNKNLQQSLAASATQQTLPQQNYSVLTNRAITPIAMYGQGYHTVCNCTMYWDKETKKAYIFIHHLMPSGTQNDYQLWAMVNNKPVSIGTFNDEVRGQFVELNNVPENATAFKVTLEKAGGAAQPNLNELYLAGQII